MPIIGPVLFVSDFPPLVPLVSKRVWCPVWPDSQLLSAEKIKKTTRCRKCMCVHLSDRILGKLNLDI